VRSRKALFGDQYGVSFGNKLITDRTSFNAAVTELRAWKSAGKPFFEWLEDHPRVDWTIFLDKLNRNYDSSPKLRALGSLNSTLARIHQEGYPMMAMWHVTCHHLQFNTTNPANPLYWQTGWEMYRWYYFGAQWLARFSIIDIEIYNEPNTDLCETPDIWRFDLRVRTQALREGYVDYNAKYGKGLVPYIVTPPHSSPGKTVYQQISVEDPSMTFSHGWQPGWQNANAYSYHQYNVKTGQSMANGHDYVRGNLTSYGAANVAVITSGRVFSIGAVQSPQSERYK
jgi:hypothetical protein